MDSMLNVAKGEHWKALRSIMSPTFSTGKLKVVNNIYIYIYTKLRMVGFLDFNVQ